MGSVCIGIDLGGTFTKFALLDRELTLLGARQAPTPTEAGADGVIEAMVEGAKGLLAEKGVALGDVVGVGIGSPGPLDLDRGIVIAMPNIPGFEDVPLRERVGKGVGVPAVLENDANAAALGEHLLGSGRGGKLMVMLTLGTGVGSGIVIDGKLLHGAHGIGAELGHMIVEPGGEECGCGQRGCLERYTSATYLAEYAQRRIEHEGIQSSLATVFGRSGTLSAKDVNEARREGDEFADEVWRRAIDYLAIGCVNVSRILDPDLIVLGGGMANAGDDLLDPLRERFAELHWRLCKPKTKLVLAELGNDAGVIGAAGAAWEKFGR